MIEQSTIGVMDPITYVPPKHSTRRNVVIVVSITVATITLFAAAWFFIIKPGLRDLANGIGQGIGQAVAGLEAGPIGASVATFQAQSLHIPLGQITLQELQSVNTRLAWIPGQASSPFVGGSKVKWTVSLMASDQHVITAVQSAAASAASVLM